MGALHSSIPPTRDLTGRVAIVTGSNAGIGYFTALHLARCGAKVYMAARSEERAKAAIQKIRLELKELGEKAGEVIWLGLDLEYPRKAKAAGEDFLFREKRLDILVNNAAKVATTDFSLTSDGLSDKMTINHTSPFVFTNTLLPLLKSTSLLAHNDVRIINVSSMMHTWLKNPKFDTLEAINTSFETYKDCNIRLYGYTKLANILFTKELQTRLSAEKFPIICMAVHPGPASTAGMGDYVKSLPLGASVLWPVTEPFIQSADQGSWTSLFAAASPNVHLNPDGYKGAYLIPYGSVALPSPYARDAKLAHQLWETTEKQLAVLGI